MFEDAKLGRPIASVQSYTSDGNAVKTDIYPAAEEKNTSSLGANFSKLIGNNVTVPMTVNGDKSIQASNDNSQDNIVTTRKKKSSSKTMEVKTVNEKENNMTVNPRSIVENTVYADTYYDTNTMTYGIINQADELLGECKQELESIRSQRNLKGKYHYINDTMASMSSLLSTKLAAIKEINGTIKAVNDDEYRRFKDLRATEAVDDNKAIMDAYSAFISAPVGAPQYSLPGTAGLTGGFNDIIRVDYPADVQKNVDAGMMSYLSNLTPEENLMLQDNNKDLEEVLVYDQATGMKRFQWMNTATGEFINNLPISSELVLEDFVIDPRTRLAKNTNLNLIKKVVMVNEGQFDKF